MRLHAAVMAHVVCHSGYEGAVSSEVPIFVDGVICRIQPLN